MSSWGVLSEPGSFNTSKLGDLLSTDLKTKKITPLVKEDRNSLSGVKYPGIYCIAISKREFSEKNFKWISDIKYVGMTNSQNGLKGRLRQFDNTINGKTGHGGADRFRYKHPNYNDLVEELFVSVCSFQCDVTSNSSEDLRVMGDVAKFENECFAIYVDKFGHLPEFNDKKKSPKK